MEDVYTKLETLSNRQRRASDELASLVDRRRKTNKGKDDRWIRDNRFRLPVPYNSLRAAKDWVRQRAEMRRVWEPWVGDYTNPKVVGKVDVEDVKREYERGWVVEDRKEGGGSDGGEGGAPEEKKDDGNNNNNNNNNNNSNYKYKIDTSPSATKTVGKSVNKYASRVIYKGGLLISGSLALLTVLRKPAKGYIPASVVVQCYLPRGKGRGAKLNDVPTRVTGSFLEKEVVGQMQMQMQMRGGGGDASGGTDERKTDEGKGKEEDTDTKTDTKTLTNPRRLLTWLSTGLRLVRHVVSGVATGKVKLSWSTEPEEAWGEISDETVRREGASEKLEIKFPAGVLARGGVRMDVVERRREGREEEEEKEKEGGGSEKEVFAHVNVSNYFLYTIVGTRPMSGYDQPGFEVHLLDVGGSRHIAKLEVPWVKYCGGGWGGGASRVGEAKNVEEIVGEFLRGGGGRC